MAKSKESRRKPEETPGWFSSLSNGRQDLVCIAVLYAAVLVLFNGLIFKDAVFSTGGDFANHFSYKHIGDQIGETEGVDALWTPYVFSGMPTFGNLSYIPLNVSYLETVVISVVGFLFLNSPQSNLIAHIFLGGVFMFWLVREWKFARLTALFAGLTFMLSPYAVGLGEVGHGSKMMAIYYLPLLVLLVHYLFEYRNLLAFGALCAGIGTLMLTRHVQIVYYVFAVMGMYLVYEIGVGAGTERARAVKTLGLFAAALAIGVCISSYLYLSVLEYAQFSIRGGGTEGAAGGLTWEYATNWSMKPVELITLLIPSFFGFQSPYYWGSMPFTSSTIYVGVIPIFLSLLALFYRRDKRMWFFVTLTGIVLLMSFGKYIGFLYQILLDYLPFFNKFRAPSTILHLLPFTLGILAAFGLTSLTEVVNDGRRRAILSKVLLYLLIALGSLLLLGAMFKTSLYQSLSGFMFVKDGEIHQYQQQYGTRATQIIEQLKQIRFYGNERISGLWGDYFRFSVLAMLAVSLALLFLRRTIKRDIFTAGLIIILIIDLSLVDAKFVNPVPAESAEEAADRNFNPPSQAITFLKKQPGLFRVFPLGADQFGDNSYAYHGLQSLGGYNAAKLKIYQTLLDSCMYRPGSRDMPVNMNIVNMLNARYFVTSIQLPASRFPVVYKDEQRGTNVYENPGSLPRAFFVDSIIVAKSDDAAFSELNSPSFDPSTAAVLQKSPPVALSAPESTSVNLAEFRSRSIKVETYASSKALLVISEIYYPAGWNATIDGIPAEIFRTNSILRSVIVPAGNHEVLLTFEPSSYAIGTIVTNVAWFFALICIFAGWGLQRFGKPPSLPKTSREKDMGDRRN